MGLLNAFISWQERREQAKFMRQVADEQKAVAKRKQEVEHLCYRMFLRHYMKRPGQSFERRVVQDGVRVRIRASFNPTEGKREIEIRAMSPGLKEACIITFSELAKPRRQEWRPKYQFVDVVPSPACRAGGSVPYTLCHCHTAVAFSFTKQKSLAAILVVNPT